MINLARLRAQASGVHVEFVVSDARDYAPEAQFDGVICLCEGALCLLAAGDDPFERDAIILRNIYNALKPGGKLIATVINGCRHLRAISDEDVRVGRYDLLSMVEYSDMQVRTEAGTTETLRVRERGYTPPELRRLMSSAGFQVTHLWGGTAGDWNRATPKLDEMELMVTAGKPGAKHPS